MSLADEDFADFDKFMEERKAVSESTKKEYPKDKEGRKYKNS